MQRIGSRIIRAIGLSSLALGQMTDTERGEEVEAVLQTERKCDEAVRRDNLAKLDQLVSDDLTRTDPSGALTDKAEWFGAIKEGRVKYFSLHRDEVTVRLYGETAVVTGIVHIRSSLVGPTGEPNTNRYLRIYVRRQGRWQLVAHQATRIGQ